jgi:hypothetical protein
MKRHLLFSPLLATLLCASEYRLETGLATSSYDYRETDASGILDTESSNFGDILGGYARLEVKLWDHDYDGSDALEVYGSHTEGETLYTGSELGSGLPYGSSTSYTENSFDDYQLNYIRCFDRGPGTFAFSGGIGYFEWQRSLSTVQIETYHWFYARLDSRVEYRFPNAVSIGFQLEGHYAIDAQMDAEMAALSETFDLGDTYTFRGNIPLTIPISKGLALIGRAEYEQTRIQHSNVIGGFYEPDSEQKNWHLYAGILFSY